MNGLSGRRSPRPFAFYDPDSSCWKTCQQSFPLENLPESLATWPRSGTWDRGAAYEQPTSVHPTSENESSSLLLLPTPRASDGEKGGPKQVQGGRPALAAVAASLAAGMSTDPLLSGGNGSSADQLPAPLF